MSLASRERARRTGRQLAVANPCLALDAMSGIGGACRSRTSPGRRAPQNAGDLAHKSVERWIRQEGYHAVDPRAAMIAAIADVVVHLGDAGPSARTLTRVSPRMIRSRSILAWDQDPSGTGVGGRSVASETSGGRDRPQRQARTSSVTADGSGRRWRIRQPARWSCATASASSFAAAGTCSCCQGRGVRRCLREGDVRLRSGWHPRTVTAACASSACARRRTRTRLVASPGRRGPALARRQRPRKGVDPL